MLEKKLIENLWEGIEDDEWKIIISHLNAEIKSKLPVLIDQGEKLVKPKLKRKWKKYLFDSQDVYSIKVFETSLQIMKLLSEGKRIEQIKEMISDYVLEEGVSPFELECAVEVVSYFHSRGKDFHRYWKQRYTLPKIKVK